MKKTSDIIIIMPFCFYLFIYFIYLFIYLFGYFIKVKNTKYTF